MKPSWLQTYCVNCHYRKFLLPPALEAAESMPSDEKWWVGWQVSGLKHGLIVKAVVFSPSTEGFFIFLIRNWIAWNHKQHIIKLCILLKLLFLFHVIKLKLAAFQLRCSQLILLKFLWSNRNYRVNQCTLLQLPNYGGLGVPDLDSYYTAAQLLFALWMLHRHNSLDWILIYYPYTSPQQIHEIIWQSPHHRLHGISNNSFLWQ